MGFSVHSVQCQSIASAQFNPSSVQSHHQFSFSSVQSILRVESVAYIVNGVQCQLSTAFTVCLLLFSVGSVPSQ